MVRSRAVLKQVQVLPTASMPFGFLLYVPPGLKAAGDGANWPLVLFLHGAGERGSSLPAVARHGPPKRVEEGQEFPFVLISPQCPISQYWDPRLLSRLLDQVEQTWPIDPQRIYATGMSMGGYGTWMVLAQEPHRFAAAAIVCGGGNSLDAARLRHLPLWFFHGQQDDIVPPFESKNLARALEAVGGNVRLTLYPDADHDSWTRTYANPELYEWLLSHRRQDGLPQP
jgi:predicted peptidase